jgi:hypothetical protein
LNSHSRRFAQCYSIIPSQASLPSAPHLRGRNFYGRQKSSLCLHPLTNYWQVQLAFRVYLSRRSSIILFIRAVSWLYCYFPSVPDLQDSVPQPNTEPSFSVPNMFCFTATRTSSSFHDLEAERKLRFGFSLKRSISPSVLSIQLIVSVKDIKWVCASLYILFIHPPAISNIFRPLENVPSLGEAKHGINLFNL